MGNMGDETFAVNVQRDNYQIAQLLFFANNSTPEMFS